MDIIFNVLRSSDNNEERKAAEAKLLEAQLSDPVAFLNYTYNIISSPANGADVRFFVATSLVDFVRNSWKNVIDSSTQVIYIQKYTDVITSEAITSQPLLRKLAVLVGIMVKRSSIKAQVGQMPQSVHLVIDTYVKALVGLFPFHMDNVSLISQVLFAIHIFLKEMRTRVIGNVLDQLSRSMVEVLSQVFASIADIDPIQVYPVYLNLLKCSLRVFGYGTFSPDFCNYLLTLLWRFTGLFDTPELEKVSRLYHYGVKIFYNIVKYFPEELKKLTLDFFIPSVSRPGGNEDRSFLNLICSFCSSPFASAFAEKTSCLSLNIIKSLYEYEDSDEMISSCLARFCQSQLHDKILLHIIVAYFPDDVSKERAEEWAADPEKALEDLEVEIDNDDSVVFCAEQLFLAMTGSTNHSTPSLARTWEVVNQFLTNSGKDNEITAALHVVGTGYYTLATENNQDYLNFLSNQLIPILRANIADCCSVAGTANAGPSVFVLRRVIWLIGMWCESVLGVDRRREVHQVLEEFVQNQTDSALILTSIKTMENFISDNSFTADELTSSSVPVIFDTVQRAMLVVKHPATFKQMAAIVYVLIEKNVVTSQGESIVNIFYPSAVKFIEYFNTKGRKEGDGFGNDDDEEDAADISTLGMLLDCLSSGVKISSDQSAVWSLFDAVVLPCTTPNNAVTPWTEDYGWELLLNLSYTASTFTETTNRALLWCFENEKRDFSSAHLVVRCAFVLLVLRNSLEGILSEAALNEWMQHLVSSVSPELSQAYLSLCCVGLLYAPDDDLRHRSFVWFCERIMECADVQSEEFALPLAVLAVFAIGVCPDAVSYMQNFFAQIQTSDLAERFVLLIDISPNMFVTRTLVKFLQFIRDCANLSEPDLKMVCDGIESGMHFYEGENRPFEEFLLEFLGEELLSSTAPHMARIMQVFSVIQNLLS